MPLRGTGPYEALSQEDESVPQRVLDLDFSKRPATYFNEGHYSPPSSSDDFVEKTPLAGHRFLDDEDDDGTRVPGSPNAYLESGGADVPRKVPVRRQTNVVLMRV